MTILDLTAHLGACHDCGARIDARGVFCHACITADERRRLTAAKGGDGEGRGTANSEAPSPSFGVVGPRRPSDPRRAPLPAATSAASTAPDGSMNATNGAACDSAVVNTTTAS